MNKLNNFYLSKVRVGTLTLGLCVSVTSYAQVPTGNAEGEKGGTVPLTAFPSDDNKFIGDHISLRTNVEGFAPVSSNDKTTRCAPMGSRFVINYQSASPEEFYVRFLSVSNENDRFLSANDEAALKACPANIRVNGFTEYKISVSELQKIDYKRTGITFGGLVVPFKYRLAGAKELVSSSTVAPYMGFRTGFGQSYGLTVTPIIAAGLSLVPVTDAVNKTTTSKSAFTVAAGMRLTSSKNESFSAGFLIGRDFLSQVDRDADPNVSKNWLSFYLGYAL